jgi:hypothetical protein
MKHITRSPGLVLTFSLALVACATAAEDDFGNGGAGGSGHGATTASSTHAATTAASTTAATTGSGQVCANQCSSDVVCQNSCPAVGANESNCCDLQTSTCFVNPASTCPPPQMGTGGMPSQY